MYHLVISIVLFQNTRDQVNNLLKIILNCNLNYHVCLIDNSPKSVFEKKSWGSKVTYIHNPDNPGFGASHNLAIKNYINLTLYNLILNPDILFNPEILEELFHYMEHNPEIGNVMPKVFYPDGSIQYLCKLLPTPYDWIGRRFNPFRFLVEKRNELFELRFTKYDKQMDVPYLSGCFMFLRNSALNKIGFFDENIFMYGEETDLCRRLIQGGYRTVFYPNVSIIHEFQKGSHKSLKLTWIGIQSAIYYFNKWGWFFDPKRRFINKNTLIRLKANL
jgi:GT2 family glycosyltransferase